MNNTSTNAVVFEEAIGNGMHGTGSLVVKCMKRDRSEFCLIGYVHPGIDDSPVVFARGSIEECRKAYRGAKLSMNSWYGVK
jgi:hypothetical protein